MSIAVGDRIPAATFKVMTGSGPAEMSSDDIFGGKKVAFFAVPGAYTPTCHAKHVPGFLACVDEFKAKGVDTIACTAVNDVFVIDSWAKDSGAVGKIQFLADGNAAFAKSIGMDTDLSAAGLGVRSKRYAMVVEDGVVQALNVEDAPSSAEKSSAQELLKVL